MSGRSPSRCGSRQSFADHRCSDIGTPCSHRYFGGAFAAQLADCAPEYGLYRTRLSGHGIAPCGAPEGCVEPGGPRIERAAEAAGGTLKRHVLACQQRFLVTLDLLARQHNRPATWDELLTVETGAR